jgi:S-adenosylmethionine:tRNA ribosyltransferase-isomerase
METKDFYYDLPEELIAQDPLEKRSDSRLLLIDRFTGAINHRHFYNIIDYLHPGDCLVINDTKVIPARLHGVKEETGAHVEVLLLQRKNATDWECLVKPGKKMRNGARVDFGDGTLKGEIIDTIDDGNRIIHFEFDGIWEEVLDKLGEMPIPPYIHHQLKEKERYNTVYAKNDGSAAAPTAGLHWTRELLQKVKDKGVEIAHITLHVGLGTFRPVKADKLEDHHMHSEFYIVEPSEAAKINKAHAEGHRVICTGTTSCRTLESAAEADGHLDAKSGWTDIFIYPGYRFKCMDALITNFHLPESTLVMLVSAFSTRENVLRAYRMAVREKYRFFSFGDACFFADFRNDKELPAELDPNLNGEVIFTSDDTIPPIGEIEGISHENK